MANVKLVPFSDRLVNNQRRQKYKIKCVSWKTTHFLCVIQYKKRGKSLKNKNELVKAILDPYRSEIEKAAQMVILVEAEEALVILEELPMVQHKLVPNLVMEKHKSL